MKVLIVAQGLFPFAGGTAFSEASLCSSIGKQCETIVLCRQGAIDYSFARSYGLKDVIEYEPREAYEAFRDPNHRLRKLFTEADVCHLNGHWRWEDHFFARTWTEMKVPYFLQPRGMLLVGHRSYWRKRAYNVVLGNYVVDNAAKVVALSNFEIRQFTPYKVPKKKILVLPNGITPVQLPALREVSPLFKKLGETDYFLYYGRLEARKNLLFLLDAYYEYIKNDGKSALYFLGPSERLYDEKLKSKIKRLGIESRAQVLSPSFQAERWHLVKHARAVVYPTLEEPFGRVPFESISAGTFPIIPDESGSAEYLAKLLPSSIYRHQDVVSLLDTLIRHDEPTAKEKKALEKARKWVHTELDWDRIVERLLAEYAEFSRHKPLPSKRRRHS